MRFRPILMTSFAFIAGLIPLVRATGPGAIGNRTIGTTAVGGMLLGTVIGVLIIPGLYYLFARLAGDGKLLEDDAEEPLDKTVEHHAGEHHHGVEHHAVEHHAVEHHHAAEHHTGEHPPVKPHPVKRHA